MKRKSFMKNASLVLLVFAWLVFSSEETFARWNSDDPTCSGLYQPNQEVNPEAWLNWWSGCITDEPEDPTLSEPPVKPPSCKNGTFTDGNGKCWKRVCINDFEWQLEACIKQVLPFPHIQSLIIRTDSYTINVAASSNKTKKQLVRPSQVSLLSLVRTMIYASELPSKNIVKIPCDFWAKQKKITLTPKSMTQ